MNENRYVILNCPTLMGNRLCYSKEIRQCADCTDCVMKQIVEYCKTTRDVYCYGQKHNIRWIDANNILKKLDIQEVE